MRVAMTVNGHEPLHRLTNENKIVCGKKLVAFAIVNVVGITPICEGCEKKLHVAYAEYDTGIIPSTQLILRYGQKMGKPYTGKIGYVVRRRVNGRNTGWQTHKTTGTVYRSSDPRIHPNDFEQACDEITRIAEKLP